MAEARTLSGMPRTLIATAVVALGAQLMLGINRGPTAPATIADLPPAPTLAGVQIIAMGEPLWLSRSLSVWLQLFDYQSGTSIPWQALDYRRLADWLNLQLLLDPRNPFPLLAALHLYGAVSDRSRIRIMLNYVVTAFRRDPALYWRWMADAAVLARHRLDDMPLAEQIASELHERTRGIPLPAWARQMHLLLRAELGEHEIASAMLAALIDSGEVYRQEEIRFLRYRLQQLQQGTAPGQ